MLARIHQCRILCLLRTEPGGELFFVGTSCRWCCCLFMRVPQLCLSNGFFNWILIINQQNKQSVFLLPRTTYQAANCCVCGWLCEWRATRSYCWLLSPRQGRSSTLVSTTAKVVAPGFPGKALLPLLVARHIYATTLQLLSDCVQAKASPSCQLVWCGHPPLCYLTP